MYLKKLAIYKRMKRKCCRIICSSFCSSVVGIMALFAFLTHQNEKNTILASYWFFTLAASNLYCLVYISALWINREKTLLSEDNILISNIFRLWWHIHHLFTHTQQLTNTAAKGKKNEKTPRADDTLCKY